MGSGETSRTDEAGALDNLIPNRCLTGGALEASYRQCFTPAHLIKSMVCMVFSWSVGLKRALRFFLLGVV